MESNQIDSKCHDHVKCNSFEQSITLCQIIAILIIGGILPSYCKSILVFQCQAAAVDITLHPGTALVPIVTPLQPIGQPAVPFPLLRPEGK